VIGEVTDGDVAHHLASTPTYGHSQECVHILRATTAHIRSWDSLDRIRRCHVGRA